MRPEDVADEERRKPLAARVLDAMSVGSSELGPSLPVRTGEVLSSDDVRALIRETIEQAAGRGDVVIVAHAASHAVTPGPEALRVLVLPRPRLA